MLPTITPRLLRGSLLLLPVFAFALASCGGDDDDGGQDNQDRGQTTVSGSPAAATSESTGANNSTPTGTDEEYAKQLCVSLNNYLDAFIAETSKDASLLTDEAKLLKVAAPILKSLGNDLGEAKPPKDVQKYHEELVSKVKEVAQKAEEGKITTLQEIADVTDGVSEPPENVQNRLQAASADVKECQDSVLGGSLFGGE